MTLSAKLETPSEEDRATATDVTCTQNLVKFAQVVPEICSRADRPTNTHREKQVIVHILHITNSATPTGGQVSDRRRFLF